MIDTWRELLNRFEDEDVLAGIKALASSGVTASKPLDLPLILMHCQNSRRDRLEMEDRDAKRAYALGEHASAAEGAPLLHAAPIPPPTERNAKPAPWTGAEHKREEERQELRRQATRLSAEEFSQRSFQIEEIGVREARMQELVEAGMGHREALSQAIRDFPLGKR